MSKLAGSTNRNRADQARQQTKQCRQRPALHAEPQAWCHPDFRGCGRYGLYGERRNSVKPRLTAWRTAAR